MTTQALGLQDLWSPCYSSGVPTDAFCAPHTKPAGHFSAGPQGLASWLGTGDPGKPPARVSKPRVCNKKKLSLVHHSPREELILLGTAKSVSLLVNSWVKRVSIEKPRLFSGGKIFLAVLTVRYIEDCSYQLCSQHHLKTPLASLTEQISRSNCLLPAWEREAFCWHDLPCLMCRGTKGTTIKLQEWKWICLVLS